MVILHYQPAFVVSLKAWQVQMQYVGPAARITYFAAVVRWQN